MSPLEFLLQAAPAWAPCTKTGNSSATIIAEAPRAGGVFSRPYHLVVAAQGSHVSVKEVTGAQLLPASCPDRHINQDGAFCLGLRADHLVDDATTARQWWEKLSVFLTCQETAHETRAWPEYAQISHGNEAAGIQLEAEDLARELGLYDEYENAILGRGGLIAFVAERVDLQTMHPRNGRATCVCGRTDKRGRPILRRQCWKADLKCLPVLERRRQREVKKFWAAFKDMPCCGTMDGCPLRRAG